MAKEEAVQEEYRDYYAKFDEDKRLLSQNITRIEFDTTVSVLGPYIASVSHLTEFGAATGRYSLHYAQQGMNVTAVELVPELVEQLNGNAKSQHLDLAVYEANATNVSFIESGTQDVVLILGPLYHIQSQSDRVAVLKEANRILKPNGVVAIAYISRFFVAGLLAKMSCSLVSPEVLSELNESGLVRSSNVDPFFRTGYFAKPSEIEELAIQSGFSVESHIATDGYVRFIGQEVNQLDEQQYQAWLKYHLSTCSEPSLLGSSNHGLVIAKKCS
ncbi:class I SAM-dependent methyltransferase [Photobacterium sanguinicancri]|uniref:Class I SAM-dependent methyltransferase n=1 Tax=Photobacterium sanguinicancri TaxID=875932 RepID=A0AAW7YCZ5_9GAMM|nr:class I SAM-dependent methyltransferase [Photobacterium sanguinicancri]MDO6545414.1 class I SAM-dependent methyltransferase [Photobacterium sanguinicancri]